MAALLQPGFEPISHRDYDLEKEKCCDRIAHFLDMLSNEPKKLGGFVDRLCEKYSHQIDSNDDFVLDETATRFPWAKATAGSYPV